MFNKKKLLITIAFSCILPFAITERVLMNNYVSSDDCGEPELSASRVLGGTEAVSGAWPWLASITFEIPKFKIGMCGGTLIGANHVLTAAHCTMDIKTKIQYLPEYFTVRLGDVDLEREDEPSSPQIFGVKKVRAHPGFSINGEVGPPAGFRFEIINDIAILILDDRVQKSKYVIPICLPFALRSENFAGRNATVVGWGLTSPGGSSSPTVQQAVLPIWRNFDCNREFSGTTLIHTSLLCAGYLESGIGICHGDSGGPLMLQGPEGRWLQIGIVSHSIGCRNPEIYTRLTEYLDWIGENLK